MLHELHGVWKSWQFINCRPQAASTPQNWTPLVHDLWNNWYLFSTNIFPLIPWKLVLKTTRQDKVAMFTWNHLRGFCKDLQRDTLLERKINSVSELFENIARKLFKILKQKWGIAIDLWRWVAFVNIKKVLLCRCRVKKVKQKQQKNHLSSSTLLALRADVYMLNINILPTSSLVFSP